jgi:hypothetical protein
MIPLEKIARGSALLFFLLATLASGTASAADAQVPSKGAAFGDKPSFQSSDLSYAASPDKQSFTITVNPAPEASVGSPATPNGPNPPVATQAFSVVIPVSGQNIDATFAISAFVQVSEGAEATMIIAVNDTDTVMRFPPGTDNGLVVQHRYRAKTASDIRLAIFLLAARDQAHPGASAAMHVDNIDGELGPPQKPGKKQ